MLEARNVTKKYGKKTAVADATFLGERQDTRSCRRKRSRKDDTFEMHGRYLQTGRRQYYIGWKTCI